MKITMQEVKKLRDLTGAGVMEVKKALVESEGELAKAKKYLQKKGLERAEKKADRETGVGYIFSYVHFNGKVGAILKLACETDFVAKTADFQTLGKEIAMQIASMDPKDTKELLSQPYLREAKKTIGELIKEISGKTGENIRVAHFSRLG